MRLMASTGERWLKNVALAFLSLGLTASVPAQAGREPPVVLPRVDVNANVPLIKIAEYQMREERYQPAAVVQGDFIYIIGGGTSQGFILDSVERFNVRTGQSEDFARLGIGRRGHRAVLIGNRIYVLGGYSIQSSQTVRPGASFMGPGNPYDASIPPVENPNAQPDPEVEDYAKRSQSRAGENTTGVFERAALDQSVEVIDLTTRKVSHTTEMPDARAQFGCVALGGKIYVIGGQRLYRHAQLARTNTVMVFDPATAKWSEGVPMPTPRETDAMLVDGRVIIVPGGYDGRTALAAVEVFDPQNNIWRILPPLSRPTSAHSLVFLDHYLFLFGDYASPGELLAYDLETKRAEIFTLQYKPARHTAAVVNQGKIYVIGGKASSVSDPLGYIQVFALRKKQ